MDGIAMKRLEVILEAPIVDRLTALLKRHGAPGWTITPAVSGYGESGEWSRTGQIIDAGRMVTLIAVMEPDQVEAVVKDVKAMLAARMGLVTVSDCVSIPLD